MREVREGRPTEDDGLRGEGPDGPCTALRGISPRPLPLCGMCDVSGVDVVDVVDDVVVDDKPCWDNTCLTSLCVSTLG